MGNPPRQLVNGIAFAKAVSVAVMVFVHASVWLVSNEDVSFINDNFLTPLIFRLSIIGLFPLMLPALAGASFYSYLSSIREAGSRERFMTSLPKITLRQSLGIFGLLLLLGAVTNWLSWGPHVSLDWDVLAFIGLSWTVITLSMRYKIGLTIDILALSCFIASPWFADTYGSTLLGSILLGRESSGFYWPFIPWFSTVVLGFRLTEFLWNFFESRTLAKQTKMLFWIGLSICGFAMVIAANFAADKLVTFGERNIWGGGVFKPGIPGLVGVAGALFGLIGLGALIFGEKSLPRYGFFNTFSFGILWIYVGHLVVGVNLSYWLKKMDHLPAVYLSFLVIVLLSSWGIGVAAVYFKHHRIRLIFRKA